MVFGTESESGIVILVADHDDVAFSHLAKRGETRRNQLTPNATALVFRQNGQGCQPQYPQTSG
jgi:hypothetical protein